MPYNPDAWQRIMFEETPVYIGKEAAQWFVPNPAGDALLQGYGGGDAVCSLSDRAFSERIPDSPDQPYPGRFPLLDYRQIKELWFHITNRCNLACSHCLFASGPKSAEEMAAEEILALAGQAHAMGCRVFALTGGEPLIHRDIEKIFQGLLDHDGVHVVILTNGMAIRQVLEKISPPDFDRLHFQISVDGLDKNHDRIRGNGKFDHLAANLYWLKSKKIPYTLSMCVDRKNLEDMAPIVDFAADAGASNVHYMWYLVRGRGDRALFAPPEEIFEQMKKAHAAAEKNKIAIDNLQGIKTQVFAPSGTIHDGSTAAWESAAVGPDGRLYPSAALVGIPALATGLEDGFEKAWQQSRILNDIRRQSIATQDHPMRFLLGGGDLDHSYIHAKTFMGDDPYLPLYEKLALYMIAREAEEGRRTDTPMLALKMGDILESCGAHGSVALVHSNCLLAVAQKDSLSVVKEFYHQAAEQPKDDILNPVCYDEDLVAHIPENFRFRGYGCGSPVTDAAISGGETVVDLGCGSGVECFIAAKMTGSAGKVIGVDMLDAMLAKAQAGRDGVARNLGYENIEFRKGYLEVLPLADNTADVVLSNCVMNLSVNKRKAYGEILRVLKPGGRLVISDVVCDTEPAPAIRNNELLRGECIAGAMTLKDLSGIINETGFEGLGLIKRFPYRDVMGHRFYSLTYTAAKPRPTEMVPVIYRGPMPGIMLSGGSVLFAGQMGKISQSEAGRLNDQVFVLDEGGQVTNLDMEAPCCCAQPPGIDIQPAAGQPCDCQSPSQDIMPVHPEEKQSAGLGFQVISAAPKRHAADCMKCGTPLTYLSCERQQVCVFCGKTETANAVCENGHFVCDRCHSMEALNVIPHILIQTDKTDMIELMAEIRSHPAVPVNGPEHHYLVPGIILATCRNLGGDVTPDMIQAGIQRGSQVSGGYCGFMGVCGAAVGVGIAFSLILDANPMKPAARSTVQTATQQVLADIAGLEAARCCQRDTWLALTKAAALSKKYLPTALTAEYPLICRQQSKNKACIRDNCPLWPVLKKG